VSRREGREIRVTDHEGTEGQVAAAKKAESEMAAPERPEPPRTGLREEEPRLLAACACRPTDATPVWFMRQAGRALPEYRAIRRRASFQEILDNPELAAEVSLLPVEHLGVDGAIVFSDLSTPLPALGFRVTMVEGRGPLVEPPIRRADDVQSLTQGDLGAVVGSLERAIGLVRAASPVPVIGFAGAPFTLATYLMDPAAGDRVETLKRFLRAQPEAGARLLDLLADLATAHLERQIRAGVQLVQLFDTWAGALSPADYRRWVLPRNRRILARVASLGIPAIHFATGTAGLLEDLAAAGGNVIGLDWRIDLGAAWRRLPGRAVQGNLDPGLLLAPWPEIAAGARSVLTAAGGRPGHVFNLGHGVHPETPVDHLRRLVDLVHEETGAGGGRATLSATDDPALPTAS
jgi:uroporphyrinogen decarboxylase